ncbi:MAG: DUF1232 domain-containing protein [Actinobacteria bacterium]|nr:DUF1232 domain-containing protein [Actinomycetota bacterium]
MADARSFACAGLDCGHDRLADRARQRRRYGGGSGFDGGSALGDRVLAGAARAGTPRVRRSRARTARLAGIPRRTCAVVRQNHLPLLSAYLAAPVDLVSNFVPVLGHVDDVIVVALALGLLVRLTPRRVIRDHLDALSASIDMAAPPPDP